MGIPFYFASLLKNHAGISKSVESCETDFLGIDFNCLIHRYLKDEEPIVSVLKALAHILTVCRAKTVFVAMDGLVPYGKIVQQRYRRFRVKEVSTFDRNQISPDTPYMRQLEEAITRMFPHIILSPTQEAGEGEHKLFQYLKKLPKQNVCIYGLDADLILLSLFNRQLGNDFFLLRESSEFNDPKLNTSEFSILSIGRLLETLPIEINQYLILCVLCFGNDFMPNLGMFSLREDGYNRAIEIHKKVNPDLNTPEGRYDFLSYASEQEIPVLKERIRLRKRPFEKAILGKDEHSFSRKYSLHILDGVQDIEPVVEAFWKTFHSTLYYFKSNEVMDWNWVYPYADAPLIQDIIDFYETKSDFGKLKFKIVDQLRFILPSASLKKTRRKQVYEDEFYTETREPWMKKFDWEMKPRLSLPWHPTDSQTSVSLL